MNASLARMLERTGVRPAGHPEASWTTIIMADSVGGLPVTDRAEGDFLWNRGFNLFVLDQGRPCYFCKVRPATAFWMHEGSVCERLAADAVLGAIVPETRRACEAGIHLQASRYVSGDVFERLVPKLRLRPLRQSLVAILDSAATLSRHAARIMPELLGDRATIQLCDAATDALDDLRTLGAPASHIAALKRVLADSAPVPRAIQHGDLWPRNIVKQGRHYWILDYESFAAVQVPLYDAAHLLRTCWAIRTTVRGVARPLTHLFTANDAEPRMFRELLRNAAVAAGLGPSDALAALAFYAVASVSRLYRRQVPDAYLRQFVYETAQFARMLASDPTLGELFTTVQD
jgi:hypothetical protein